MQLTSTSSEIRLRNTEQFLGPKEERYFASGYKKITCELFDYHFSDDKLTTSLNLNCGKGWSTKNGKIIDHRLTSIDIGNLLLNLENRSVIAESKVTHPNKVFEAGLGTKNLQGLSFVEFLSIAGQLTQVLLYKLENSSREESNNMWVRSLSADFLPVKTNQQIEVTSKAYFTEFNLVKVKGELWRTVSAKFEIGNIQGAAKVCHII